MIEPPTVGQHDQITYYAWQRTEGSRAYIVIDDDLDSLSLSTGGVADQTAPPTIHGLLPLRRQVWHWRSTRAFAFFPMLSSMDLNESVLIPAILGWLSTIGELRSAAFFLDVFYGTGTSNSLGDKLAERLALEIVGRHWQPQICFLSKAGPDFISAGSKAAQRWRTFSKGDLHQGRSLPNELLDYLGIDASDRSDVYSTKQFTPSEWNRLRLCARSACTRIYEQHRGQRGSPLNSVRWPHHLPFGGETYPADQAKNKEYIAGRFSELREEVTKTYPGVAQWPDYEWQGAIADAPGYCRPPIRALSQFDSDARDLTTSFALGLRAARNALTDGFVSVSQLSLDHKRDRFFHDYLWFNTGPLLCGLELLASDLQLYVETLLNDDERVRDLGFYRAERPFECEMMWRIHEYTREAGNDSVASGLEIEITQFLTAKWTVSDETTKFSLLRKLCPLSEEMGNRKNTNCWEPIRASGGDIAFRDGVLVITVPARRSALSTKQRIIWEVAE